MRVRPPGLRGRELSDVRRWSERCVHQLRWAAALDARGPVLRSVWPRILCRQCHGRLRDLRRVVPHLQRARSVGLPLVPCARHTCVPRTRGRRWRRHLQCQLPRGVLHRRATRVPRVPQLLRHVPRTLLDRLHIVRRSYLLGAWWLPGRDQAALAGPQLREGVCRGHVPHRVAQLLGMRRGLLGLPRPLSQRVHRVHARRGQTARPLRPSLPYRSVRAGGRVRRVRGGMQPLRRLWAVPPLRAPSLPARGAVLPELPAQVLCGPRQLMPGLRLHVPDVRRAGRGGLPHVRCRHSALRGRRLRRVVPCRPRP